MPPEGDIYGTGLNSEDWYALAALVNPYFDSILVEGRYELVSPGAIDNLADVPAHLRRHPVVGMIRRYRRTGDRKFLHRAGQLLVPNSKSWNVVLSKT